MRGILLVHMKTVWSIWVVGGGFFRHHCFPLPLQTKQTLSEGNAGKCGDDKHSSRTQGHTLQPGQSGSVEELRGKGESGCFKGSKQNIMRKKGWKRKKMPGSLLVRNWGQVFSHKDWMSHTNTHTHTHSNSTHWCLQLVLIQRSERKATSCFWCKTTIKVCLIRRDAFTAWASAHIGHVILSQSKNWSQTLRYSVIRGQIHSHIWLLISKISARRVNRM